MNTQEVLADLKNYIKTSAIVFRLTIESVRLDMGRRDKQGVQADLPAHGAGRDYDEVQAGIEVILISLFGDFLLDWVGAMFLFPTILISTLE